MGFFAAFFFYTGNHISYLKIYIAKYLWNEETHSPTRWQFQFNFLLPHSPVRQTPTRQLAVLFCIRLVRYSLKAYHNSEVSLWLISIITDHVDFGWRQVLYSNEKKSHIFDQIPRYYDNIEGMTLLHKILIGWDFFILFFLVRISGIHIILYYSTLFYTLYKG